MGTYKPHEAQQAKCNRLLMSRGNLKHEYKLGDEYIDVSPEKDLVLVDELNMSQHCALVVRKQLSWATSIAGNQMR